MLEYNKENCHILLNNENKNITNDWTLITGIADPIHIYYRYNLDIETREIELFFKKHTSII